MAFAPVIDRPASPPPPNSHRLERRITLFLTVGPLLGLVVAVASFWMRGISGLDLSLLAGMYVVSGLGVTVGYHRLLTHGSFRAGPRLRSALAVAGSLAVQGSVVVWVADHRRHHAFADMKGDPHSPHLEEAEGVRGVLKGLWHAHTGWLFRPAEERTDIPRYAPDLLREPGIMAVDRLFPVLSLISLTLPAAVGLIITGSVGGAATAFLWGGVVRMFLLHHVTWSINSICHFYGRRPFETRDRSTNNWALSLLSFGESWHNNHHAFPSSAVHGIGRGQIDLTFAVIRGLERIGLVQDVKRAAPERVGARRRVSL